MKLKGFISTTRSASTCCALLLTLLAGCSAPDDAINRAARQIEADGGTAPGLREAVDISEHGFIYGLPIVMNYVVMYEYFVDRDSGQWKAPFNQILNEHRVFTYKDTTVIGPNSDTPYSVVGMDLRAEPLVISVPAVEKARYYSVQLVDSNTFIFGYIGSRATGNEPGEYLVVGPDWQGATPPGIKQVFHASAQFALAIFRTQLLNPADMNKVIEVQSGYRAQPLSAWLGQQTPAAAPDIDFPKASTELAKINFFNYLDFALQFAPAGPEEQAARSQLARLGIGTGLGFDFEKLSPLHKFAIGLGMKRGLNQVEHRAANLGKDVNGWRVGASFGGRDFYQGDWLLRAAAAKAGIYGNSADEAVYPLTRKDAEGATIDTSKHNYSLTFPAGQLPPVNAFWSVTMYDGVSELLIKNPIDRYLINSPMLPDLQRNADGSLTLYIQKDSTGKDKESNWLPAPDGPVYLSMRLYWPRTEQPSALPPGEGSWQPPAVLRVP